MSLAPSIPPARVLGLFPVLLLLSGSAATTGSAADAGTSRGAPSVLQPGGLYQVPYNGDFTFTRIRYGAPGARDGYGRAWQSSSWNHDYPGADRNLQSIIGEFTYLRSNTSGSNVLDLEDPRIFHHPILYMSEPGFWTATDEGLQNLRDFLLKGGFLIFDDFEAEQWDNMAAHVRRALPDHEWVELDDSHPIFRSFYLFEDVHVPHPLVTVPPNYQAIFEDNDPRKRMMILANHNSDLGEYWEWSTRGSFGMAPTNDAYRLGVNYIIYGITH